MPLWGDVAFGSGVGDGEWGGGTAGGSGEASGGVVECIEGEGVGLAPTADDLCHQARGLLSLDVDAIKDIQNVVRRKKENSEEDEVLEDLNTQVGLGRA
eukprot:evm.model.scf_2494.3 EVM.evm.TU.scf_2494.3   scf_2494:13923-14677(+)